MAKEKDPAFLLYSKDWIDGTAEMLPEEKGVYIDLLCHQHQHGSIPKDISRLARIVRLSIDQFSKIWAEVSKKFIDFGPDRMVNRKLTAVMTDRSEKGHKNAIIGKFAALCRGLDLSKKNYILLKNKFKIDEFIPFSTEQATERLTERFNEWLKSIEDGNEDAIEIEDATENKKGGKGGKKKLDLSEIVYPFNSPEFFATWERWMKYRQDIKKPYKSILSVQGALKYLSKYKEDVAIQIIVQSISNQWQGFWELKTVNNGQFTRANIEEQKRIERNDLRAAAQSILQGNTPPNG